MRTPSIRTSRHGSLRGAAIGLASLVALTILPGARGDVCAPVENEVTGVAAAATITLRGMEGGKPVCDACLTAAATAWNNACSEDHIPSFSIGSSGVVMADVAFVSGNNPGTIPNCSTSKCGCTTLVIQNGAIKGADVALFESATGTPDCESDWSSVLTHELGHVLGLAEAPACSTRIMGNVFAGIKIKDCESADGNFKSGVELTVDPDDDSHPCSNPRV